MMNRTKTLQKRGSLFFALLAFTLISLFSFPEKVNAQKFKKLDNGVADTVVASCTDSNNNYYVVYRTNYKYNSNNFPVEFTFHVAKWDGTNWTNFPEYKLDSVYIGSALPLKHINAIKIYQGQIYLAGMLFSGGFEKTYPYNPVDIRKKSFILRLNNQKWDTIYVPNLTGYHYGVDNRSLAVFKNKLYLSADFNVYSWDGSKLASCHNVNSNYPINGLGKLLSTKDYLYLYGNFKMIDSINCNAIAKWDGYQWSPESNDFDNVTSLHLFQNKLHAFGGIVDKTSGNWDNFFATKININNWKKDTTKIINLGNYFALYPEATNFNDNQLLFKPFGYRRLDILAWNGTTWKKYNVIDTITYSGMNYYFNINSINDKLFLSGSFKTIDSDTFNFVTEYNFNPQGTIIGKIFQDNNGNCIQDSTEKGIANQLIKVLPGAYYIKTDQNGNYSYKLDSGSYTLTALPKKYYTQNCPTQNGALNINVRADSVYKNLDFAFQPVAGISDVKISLVSTIGFRARAGFTESYKISYENLGTTDIDSCSINLSYTKNIKNIFSNPAVDSNFSGIATWHFNNLKVGEKRNIYFSAKVDSAGKLNDTVKFVVYTDNNIYLKDTDKVNNTDTLYQRLVSSIDPNDKQAFPDSIIVPGTKEIRYYIRFQNTGNDTAYKIVVKDTLDKNVVVSGFEMIGSSHEYTLDTTNGILTWTFNNILLPDSNTNEPLSHGYISYKVKLKDSLAIGTEIRNTAYIYFDFQPAVITNTTLNTIKSKVIVTAIHQEKTKQINPGLKVYPNPAISSFIIENTSAERQNLSMINMMGQIVKIIQVNAGEKTTIDASQLPQGMYFIKSTDKVNSASIKVLIQQ